MDISALAHAKHDYCSPIGGDTVRRIVSAVDLPENARCVDYGCGKGQLLLDILGTYVTATGIGYDADRHFIADARERAVRAGLQTRVTFESKRIDGSGVVPECDLAICFGSTHIFGGFAQTLDALARTLRPGGKVLLADGYWKRKPSPDYLREFYESAEGDLLYIAQMLDAIRAAGLSAPYILTTAIESGSSTKACGPRSSRRFPTAWKMRKRPKRCASARKRAVTTTGFTAAAKRWATP